MPNVLDSRALARTDCFAQRFMRPGRYAYNVLPAHSRALADDRPFAILVEDGGRTPEMKQHNLLIDRRDGRFVPSAKELKIATGDLVLWNCVDGKAGTYSVVGDQEFFDSGKMVNECGYSHAFGMPGEYVWKDAYGSGLSGSVKVIDPQCCCEADVKKWRSKLSKGTIVMIAGDKAEPKSVEVMTGQTVFFAVVKSTGISITDERLLAIAPGPCGSHEGKEDKPKKSDKKK
jgi:plastocyanin